MQGMFQDLESLRDKPSARTIIYSLIVAVVIFIITYLNLFGFGPEDHANHLRFALALSAVIVVFSIVKWLRSKNRCFTRGVKNYCSRTAYPEETKARLEKTWSEGFDFGSGWMDKEYIIWLEWNGSKVIPLSKAVWAAKGTKKGPKGQAFYFMNVYFDDGAIESHIHHQEVIDGILGYIFKNCPQIAVGGKIEIKELFMNRDYSALEEYAFNQRNEELESEFSEE